jgi:formylglycine-generating enzyme
MAIRRRFRLVFVFFLLLFLFGAVVLTAAQTPPDLSAPTPVPTLSPDLRAEQGVDRNGEWKPYIEVIDDVEMVLVPVGCFMMGSEDADNDERPLHQQCFEEPFYIDRVEVTNLQYGSSGAFAGDDRPRDNVTWFEARDYCAARDARLPTEAEWQYAARGPDNLVYPWGNRFVESNVISGYTIDHQTAGVYELLEGVSWVGALHMSGNVWEWVSTLYRDYPYTTNDGREDLEDTINERVILGGSWSLNADNVRAAERYFYTPDTRMDDVGFRCARDYGKG